MYQELSLTLGSPRLYVLTASESDAGNYFYALTQTMADNARVITLRGQKMHTLTSMFDEISAALQFPYYFGNNGAALDECINDMSWMPAKAYILCLTNCDAVLGDNTAGFELLIEILADAAIRWENGHPGNPLEEHAPTPFRVILQSADSHVESVKEKIVSLLGMSSFEQLSL